MRCLSFDDAALASRTVTWANVRDQKATSGWIYDVVFLRSTQLFSWSGNAGAARQDSSAPPHVQVCDRKHKGICHRWFQIWRSSARASARILSVPLEHTGGTLVDTFS
jgi:hypothetical protein